MISGKTAVAPSILDLIDSTCELPTIPDVLVKLQAVIDDPESSADEVAEVIALDPAIATNVLRIVNSAHYGLQVRVSSVNLAVSIMGFSMTKKVALKAAILSAFGEREGGVVGRFDPSTFWRHSIFTGVLTRTIGEASPAFSGVHPEDLYICGLLHDIGTIILCDSAPEAVGEILERSASTGEHVAAIEQEVLGYTHAEVGSVLAIKWFLPEDLTIAIRYHETPAEDPFHRGLSTLVYMAERHAAHAGYPAVEGVALPDLDLTDLGLLEIAEDDMPGLVEKAQETFAASGTPW